MSDLEAATFRRTGFFRELFEKYSHCTTGAETKAIPWRLSLRYYDEAAAT